MSERRVSLTARIIIYKIGQNRSTLFKKIQLLPKKYQDLDVLGVRSGNGGIKPGSIEFRQVAKYASKPMKRTKQQLRSYRLQS